jgi:hypothetical protein
MANLPCNAPSKNVKSYTSTLSGVSFSNFPTNDVQIAGQVWLQGQHVWNGFNWTSSIFIWPSGHPWYRWPVPVPVGWLPPIYRTQDSGHPQYLLGYLVDFRVAYFNCYSAVNCIADWTHVPAPGCQIGKLYLWTTGFHEPCNIYSLLSLFYWLPTRNLVQKSVGYRGLITVTAPYYVSYPFWELTCSVLDATRTRCTLLKRFESRISVLVQFIPPPRIFSIFFGPVECVHVTFAESSTLMGTFALFYSQDP